MAVEENFPKERTGQFIYSTPRKLLVIVASYLKRRNPNDSWIALYPIVDRNFHVRLPESLKERERERLGSRKSGRRFIAAIRARSDAYYRKTRRFAETKRGEACTRIT